MSNSGLLAFPRVGRSDQVSWELDNDSHDTNKRSKFMQFPRVGRAEYMDLRQQDGAGNGFWKRGGGNKNSGLWFGPRLGRLQKRGDSNKEDAVLGYLIEYYPQQLHYTPRLGRESEEVDDMETSASKTVSENN